MEKGTGDSKGLSKDELEAIITFVEKVARKSGEKTEHEEYGYIAFTKREVGLGGELRAVHEEDSAGSHNLEIYNNGGRVLDVSYVEEGLNPIVNSYVPGSWKTTIDKLILDNKPKGKF